ncbi:MAG TPA: trypsin-like peptidase domain-containing protein [Nocardioidaceae bacterium]|nr:trypsin-like peptidase domain-containing protein [Nocardioidaceae bacterium]
MTNEQERPPEPDNEPTEVLGDTGAPQHEDTAQLWPPPQQAQYPPPPPYPYTYGQTQPQYPQPQDPQPQYVEPQPVAPQPPVQQPEYSPSHYGQAPYEQAPYEQAPQPQYDPWGYEYAQYSQTQPTQEPPKVRVPGWLWPVVAATALIVGTIGGAIGGTIVAGDSTSNDGFFDASTDPTGEVDALPSSEAPLPEGNASIAAVAAQLLPSTVQVNARGGTGTGEGGTGSGFVVDDKGHVITNNHVVADATGKDEIEVVDHDGRSHSARIIGRSPVYDIAVLAIDNYEGLQPAALGSSRAMRIGETVVAFGSPLGLSSTVTSGIISAIDRPVTTSGESGDSSYINAVQTDAAINPGNSGGPLVNLRGQVVGVNSAIATTGGTGDEQAGSIGVGFAIPMEQVRITARQILRTGEAQYPIIGANVNTLPEKKGAHIVDVSVGDPAAIAGLRKDDLVVAVNGKPVEDSIGLIVAIRAHQPGDTITLTYLRSGSPNDVEITLDAQSDRPE